MQKTIPYGRQYIDDADDKAVVRTLRSDYLTQGPNIAEFENTLCKVTGSKFAVAVNSGTSALHLACLAAGVQKGDEVVTSCNTFVASANCAVYCGAKPVLADIDPRTYNINPDEIDKRFSSRTHAIIPVHFAGQSCDMRIIQKIVREKERRYGHKVFIIEDACHALGSFHRGRGVGSCQYSDMCIMSFHPVKHITTGEGGVVLTRDPELFKKLKSLRSHGITSVPEEFVNKEQAFETNLESGKLEINPWYYEQISLGYNYRITDIQCALGISQLKKLSKFIDRRREIVNLYNESFKNLEFVKTPYESEENISNFHLYILLFDFEGMKISRAQFMGKLRKAGIQTQVHYIPVHLHPYYQNQFGYRAGNFPVAENFYKRTLSLPIYPGLTNTDAERVIQSVRQLALGKAAL